MTAGLPPDGGRSNLNGAAIASRGSAPAPVTGTGGPAPSTQLSSPKLTSTSGGSVARPMAQSAPSGLIVQPPGITQMASNTVPSIVGAPLVVLDANTGVTLPTSTPLPSFSTWNMSLKAQAIGKTVSTYAWNLSQAPDATGATGTSTYNLQFQWASFVSMTKTGTVSLTVTYTDTTQQTLPYTFQFSGYNSPAFSAAPTSSATWATVITPDQVSAGQATVAAGSYASLGLADGGVQTSHSLPAYNPTSPRSRSTIPPVPPIHCRSSWCTTRSAAARRSRPRLAPN